MNREEYIIWEAGIKTIFKPVGQNQPEETPVQKENQAKAGLRERIQGLASSAKRAVDTAVEKGVEKVRSVADKFQHNGTTPNGETAKANLQANKVEHKQPTNKSSLAQNFQRGMSNIKNLKNKITQPQPKQMALDFKGANKAAKAEEKAKVDAVKAQEKAKEQEVKNANLDQSGQARLNLNKTLSPADKVKNNLQTAKNNINQGANDLKQKLKAGYNNFKEIASKTASNVKDNVNSVVQKVKDNLDKSPKQMKLDFNKKPSETAEQLKLNIPPAEKEKSTSLSTVKNTNGTFKKDGFTYGTATKYNKGEAPIDAKDDNAIDMEKTADGSYAPKLKQTYRQTHSKVQNNVVPIDKNSTQGTFNKDGQTYTTNGIPKEKGTALSVIPNRPGGGTFSKDGKIYTTSTGQEVKTNLQNKANANKSTEDKANATANSNATFKTDKNFKSKHAFDVWRNLQKNKSQAITDEPQSDTKDTTNYKTTAHASSNATNEPDVTNEPKKETTLGQKVKDGLSKAYDGVIRAQVKAKNFKDDLISDYKSRRGRIENEETLKRLQKMVANNASNSKILDEINKIKSQLNNTSSNNGDDVRSRIEKAREQVRQAHASQKSTGTTSTDSQGATQVTGTRGTPSNANAQTNTSKVNTKTTNTATNNQNQANAGTANAGDATAKGTEPKAEGQTTTTVGNSEQPVTNTNNTQPVNNEPQVKTEQPVEQQPEVSTEPVQPEQTAEQPEQPTEVEQPTVNNQTETGKMVVQGLTRPRAISGQENFANSLRTQEIDKAASMVKSLSFKPDSKGKINLTVNGANVTMNPKHAEPVSRLLGKAVHDAKNGTISQSRNSIKNELAKYFPTLPKTAIANMVSNAIKNNGRIGEIKYKVIPTDENGVQHLEGGPANGSVDKWSQFLRTKYKGAKQVTPYANTDVNAFVKTMSNPNFDVNNLDEKAKAIYDDLKECGLISVGPDGKSVPLFQKIDNNGKIVYNPVEQTGPKAIVNGKTVDMPAQKNVGEPTNTVEPPVETPVQPEQPTEAPVENPPQPEQPVNQVPVEPQPTEQQPTNNVITNAINTAVTNAVNQVLGINQQNQNVQQPVEQQPEVSTEPVQPEQPVDNTAKTPTSTEIETPEVVDNGEPTPSIDSVANTNVETPNRIPTQPLVEPTFDFNNPDGTRNSINQYVTDLNNQAQQEYQTKVEELNKFIASMKGIPTAEWTYKDEMNKAKLAYDGKLAQNRETANNMLKSFDKQLLDHQQNIEASNARNDINNALGGDSSTLVEPAQKPASVEPNKKPSEMTEEEIKQFNLENARNRYNPLERLSNARKEAFENHFWSVSDKANKAVNTNDIKTATKLLGKATTDDPSFIQYMNWKAQVINKMKEDGVVDKTKKGLANLKEQDIAQYLKTLPNGQRALDYYEDIRTNKMVQWYKNAWNEKIYNQENANIPNKLPEDDYHAYLRDLGLEETTDEKTGETTIDKVPSKYPGGVQRRPFTKTFKSLAFDGEYNDIKAENLSPEIKNALKQYSDYTEMIKNGVKEDGSKATNLDIKAMNAKMERLMYDIANNDDYARELGFTPTKRVTTYNTGKSETNSKGINLTGRIGKNKTK